ncbi:MAG TPA: branched-chain amino acid ABC transporter ATP-binding protein/permease [Candidatus Binatia bacterium]|nr:branched-chain amino acid ABC transporter ATP-binding protein/permease [Candidatus Binatia bacterium]
MRAVLAAAARVLERHGILVAAAVLLLAPLVADYTPFYLALLTEVLVFGLFALAYDILLGHTGVLSLGHSAFIGVAAYTTGMLLANFRAMPVELAVVAGALGGLATSLLMGPLALRKRGVYLAMLTLALSQVFYYAVLMWPATGGTDGLGNLPRLVLSDALGGVRLSRRPVALYLFVAITVFLAMLVIRRILRSPFGRVLRAVKANERRAQACGYDTRRVKLVAFALSGLFSGLAGALLTVTLEFVPIENVYWPMSGTVLIMTLFGGTGTLLGPFVGSAVFLWMRDFLSKHLEYWEVFVGGSFVLIVLFLPEGIVGTLRRLARQWRPAMTPAAAAAPAPAAIPARPPAGADSPPGAVDPGAPPLLESRGLTMRFGGLTAVDGVDFQVRRGELRAVIGPNGAGKTTFFNMLTGVLPPTAGRVLLEGRDVTGLPAHTVSRLGVARSYQVTNIFADLSVFENVRIAAQSRVTTYRFWRDADGLAEVNDRAERILARLGLVAQRDLPAGALSHGEQRYLEIGIALATEPAFLLLDEPTAGMSPEETRRTAAFIRDLAGSVTIVLVEHDMEVVMGVSDRITVLNYGQVLAEGTPAEIRQNADVRRVYLRD